MKNVKKHWQTIVFVIAIALLIIPQTKVFILRLVSFSPSELSIDKQQEVNFSNVVFKGINGENLEEKDFKDKVVLLNFWATWCPPCVAEMPSMQKLHDIYKDNVVFAFVTNDEKEIVNKFLKKYQYHLPVYTNLGTLPKELLSSSIPATFLIDKKGKIKIKKIGAADWNSDKIHVLLDELISK